MIREFWINLETKKPYLDDFAFTAWTKPLRKDCKQVHVREVLEGEITDTDRFNRMVEDQKVPEFQSEIKDWCKGGWYYRYRNEYFKTPREAIDEAIRGSK